MAYPVPSAGKETRGLGIAVVTRRMTLALLFFLILAGLQTIPAESSIEWPSNWDGASVLLIEGRLRVLDAREAASGYTISLRPRPEVLRLSFLPVQISGVALSSGVASLDFATSVGEERFFLLPRKRFLLPIPFMARIPEAGYEQDGRAEPLLAQVHPKISKRVDVDLDRTGDFGLVAKLGYEKAVRVTVLDTLNEADRRDVHATIQVASHRGEFVEVQGRHLLANQNPRKIDLIRRQRFSRTLLGDFRLDNVEGEEKLRLGANAIFQNGRTTWILGNVHHRVERDLHLEVRRPLGTFTLIARAERLTTPKSDVQKGTGLRLDRLGAGLSYRDGDWDLTLGTLRVERVLEDLEEGKVDGELNFALTRRLYWGSPILPRDPRRLAFSGESGLGLVGFGSDAFLRGHIFADVQFGPVYSLRTRWFSDFLTLSGADQGSVWESLRATFMRQRDWFEDRSFLERFGLQYIFVEAEWKRSGTEAFNPPDIRLGIGKDLTLFGFALPLEVFLNMKEGAFSVRGAISTRSFL